MRSVMPEPGAGKVLIVIPTLNEEAHIAQVLDGIAAFANRRDALVVVADGGSRDRTCEIVRARAARDPRVRLLDNPRRLQAAEARLLAFLRQHRLRGPAVAAGATDAQAARKSKRTASRSIATR